MLKKQYTVVLLFILTFPIVNSTHRHIGNNFNDTNSVFNNTENPATIKNKINEYDPRGYLTGRMFFKGFLDLEPNEMQDSLLIEVEVNITQSLANPVIVYALLYDNSFVKVTSQSGYVEGMDIWGSSAQESLPIGVHNVTVSFNTTTLRILRLAGPYMITNVKLGEVSVGFFSEMDSNDWLKPLLKIPKVFDIWGFDEPKNITSNIGAVQEVTLSNETLRFAFYFTSFGHGHPEAEDYYVSLVLKNASGSTIVNYGKTIDLEPNTVHWIQLDIPAKYISAFKTKTGAFASNTLRFEELTIVQLTGDYDVFNNQSFNFSYTRLAYEETTLDPNTVNTPVNVINSGEYIDFGLMDLYENKSIIIYSDDLTEVLKLQINRTEPPDYSGPSFEFWVIDGFFREKDIWDMDPSSTWLLRRNYWDKTEISNIYHQIGQYHGAIEFWIKYPDYGWETNPSQKLEVQCEIINDTDAPLVNISDPLPDTTFQQYYGIPIKGQSIEDTLVYEYQLVYNNKVLMSFSPIFSMLGWGAPPGTSGEFSFIWFPVHSLTGTLDLSIRAIDIIGNVGEKALSITINPGTKPSPEGTIEKGLQWLKDQQAPDGSWNYFNMPSSGMTALATICFIQAGLTFDPLFQPVVDKAINYLMNAFEDSDEPSVPGKVIRQSGHATYESAMAVTALIAYNATRPSYESDLNDIINGAIEWLVATQNDETWGVTPDKPWYGGWRYGYDHQSSDLSVSQWVFLALATYGYDDPNLWNKVKIFVNRCRGTYEVNGTWFYDGGFSYTPSTEDWRDFGGGSYGSMTAAGIWGLYLSGEAPDNENITQALDWIGSLPPEEIVGQNPRFGKSFEYYWYLSASKAYLMAGRPQDEWWYDMITEYLNTHMISATETSAFWDNSLGGESPVMATVEAVLSQQVFYGNAPMDRLEISVESQDGATVLGVWNETFFTGYNYSAAQFIVSPNTLYTDVTDKKPIVTIYAPTKGEYFIEFFPTTDRDSFLDQDMILRARALTSEGNIISHKAKMIHYQYGGQSPQVLRYKLVYSTVSGVNLEFLDVNPPVFSHNLLLTSLSYPGWVNSGDDFDITLSVKHIGVTSLTSCLFKTSSTLTGDTTSSENFNPDEQKTFTIHATTQPDDIGEEVILIYLGATDTNPLFIRITIQIGNHAPEGSFDSIPDSISGTFNVSWSASDEDNDSLTFTLALVKPDGDTVSLATTTKTYYNFDTTAYPDASGYAFELTITDGIDSKSFYSNSFTIDNVPNTSTGPELNTPSFNFIITLIGIVILYHTKKRNK